MFVKGTLLFIPLDFTCKSIVRYLHNNVRGEKEIRDQGRCKQGKMTSSITSKSVLSQLNNEII